MNLTTKKITTVGMLCAMAIIVNLFIRFPIVPSVSFLNYDPKDIVIVIGGFIYGPAVCFIMSAITSVLEIMFRGGTILYVLMNIISTCTFAVTAAYFYKKNHTKKGAIIGLVIGIVACAISMLIWNYVVDPIYFQMPREAVVSMLPAILLFNLLKAGMNTGVTIFLYKPIVNALRKTNLVENNGQIQSNSHDMLILGIFIIISVICLILGIQNII